MAVNRRAMIGTGLALLAAPIVQAQEQTKTAWQLRQERRRAFIEEIAAVHPNGRMVATKAMSLDMVEPDDCTGMVTWLRDDNGRLPILYFKKPGDRPVEIVVSAFGAYEHGPVI